MTFNNKNFYYLVRFYNREPHTHTQTHPLANKKRSISSITVKRLSVISNENELR